MKDWIFDIERQGSWDLWCWVCLAAAGVLALHGVVGWVSGYRRSALWLVPVGLTGVVLFVPGLRLPAIGLIWTLVVLALVSISQYSELRPTITRRKTSILLSLRLIALILAVPMLFEPVFRFTSRKDPDRALVLLVDGSGSMSVPDTPNGPTRIQAASQALAGQWQRIGERFQPQIRVIASQTPSQPRNPQELAQAPADGSATDLAGALQSALKGLTPGEADLVLLSDGVDNVSPDVVASIRAQRWPVHTVVVGSETAQPATLANVAIRSVDPGEEWTVRSAASVKVNVKSSALASRIVDVHMGEVDEKGSPVGTPLAKQLVLQSEAVGQEVQFDYTPARTGIHRIGVWIDPIAGERTVADNRRVFQQLATDARVRVLYVEGRVRPEYRELSRALARDASIELAKLVRVTAERFSGDGTIDGKPVTALPVTPEQWRRIDVIILGDLDSSFLTRQQLKAIEQAVLEGSGLLMLGGQSSFGPGGYANTPVEAALPVWVGGRDSPQDRTEFIPQLTPAGKAHPAMEGLAEWFTGKPASDGLPTLLGNVVVGKARQGAEVILTHPRETDPQIVLATQLYGKGRSAAFTADTTYRWYLPMRGLGQNGPYTVFWGQLVRWLAGADVKNRGTKPGIETIVDKSVFAVGESVRVRALVRDARGDVTRFAQVSLKLTSASNSGDTRSLSLAPVGMRDGMYEATLEGLARGEWSGEAVATKDGAELGRQKLTFSVIPPADEMLALAADTAGMRRIASETGAYAYTLSQLPQLVEVLSRAQGADGLIVQRSVPLHNTARALLATMSIYPAWPERYDLPTQAVLVVVLLAGEWVLRRRWQLL